MSTTAAPVSRPPVALVSGKGQASSPSSKPPEKVVDQVFNEMPQQDSPPNLRKFSARLRFPSWTSQFPMYPEGMKPRYPTRLAKENVPQPSSNKHSRSSSDESFNPFAHSLGDEEEIKVEQVVRPKPQLKKK